jgi:hypothetical protein
MPWECFKDLINTGPDLAIQDPILLQHFRRFVLACLYQFEEKYS